MDLINEGRYLGRPRSAMSVGKSSGGNLQVAVTLDLLNDGCDGMSLAWFGTLGASDESDDITIRQLRDMGWTGTDLDDPSGIGTVDVTVVVKHEEFNGKIRHKASVWPKGGSTFAFAEPAPKASIAAMNAKLRGKFTLTAKQAAGGSKSTDFPPY